MRILQVINSVDTADGGPVEIVLQLCSSLNAMGDRPEVLVTRAPQPVAQRRLGGIPVHCRGPALGRYGYAPAARRWLEDNVARFDAIVIHGIWQHCAIAAATAARARGVPYFVYPHGALDEALPALYPLRHAKKVAYWHLAGRRLLERAAGVCFTVDEERDRATAFRGNWNAVVTGAGIEPADIAGGEAVAAFLSRFPGLRDMRIVLFMGRLVPLKGVDMLIRGFARARAAAPEWRLLIAGRGAPAYERSLARIVEETRCADAVTFAGSLEDRAKWAALGLAEVFALPSHRDSFGVAVVEALAAGTPVLVTRSVGVAAVVERCGAGTVCADDEMAFANALERVLREPAAAAPRAAARRCYEENFRIRDAAERLRNAIAGAGAAARPIS